MSAASTLPASSVKVTGSDPLVAPRSSLLREVARC
jgi:hypothetical protein